ncbi:hypothetical protein BJV82DRAFT_165579 [Fennellomyces sp. T-0311]|nr:hypothetical protein BJV82DRAFT_165579 [Fennellomyces sp. T-0311]
MLQELPTELLSCIASYLSAESAGALAQTCRRCYCSAIPVLYNELPIAKPDDLFVLSKKLSTATLLAQRARQYVRAVSVVDHGQRTLSRYAVTSILNHVLSGWELNEEDDDEPRNDPKKKRYDALVNKLHVMFPRLDNLTIEFDVVTHGLYFGHSHLPPVATNFSGYFKLINYRPNHTSYLRTILAPFACCTQLTLFTRPYLSLCAAIQDSVLTDKDIDTLTDLKLDHLCRLELAYVDDLLDVHKLIKLIESLPYLEYLSLEWILPPSLDYFDELCECLAHAVFLYPGPITRIKSTYFVAFQQRDAHVSKVNTLMKSMGISSE